jgi:hypothetical protein
LKATSREERARQIELARAIHTALIETALPPEVVEAIKRA